jgi:hypothetical protein
MMAGVAGDWTLDELAGRVAEALAVGDVRAPNGRVTEVPDGRVIRWYTTIGIVDRPNAMRGRTALYGPRHLLQLVAVKRLQARGRSLADIQADLAGATDLTLRRIAAIPPDVLAAAPPIVPADAHPSAERSIRTGAARRGAPAPAASGDGPGSPDGKSSADGLPAPNGSTVPSRSRFWAGAHGPDVERGRVAPAAAEVAPAAAESAAIGDDASAAAGGRDTVRAMHGLALGDGAVLLLPAPIPEQLGPDDVAAIQAAAQPLLDLLAARWRPPRSKAARPDVVRPDVERPDDEPRAEGAHR